MNGKDIYAVFDGHNGYQAAQICIQNLKKFYLECNGDLTALFEKLHNKSISETSAGCTASVVVFDNANKTIEIACVGDSPIFAVRSDKIDKLSVDHKASNSEEEKLIIENGGVVMPLFGQKRVNGQILVTRSIGDKSLHPPLTCVPYIQKITLDDSYKYITVMSDGITDALTSQEIFTILSDAENSLTFKTQGLRNKAFKKGSKDNISVLVVEL